jgi:hypothetical protein
MGRKAHIGFHAVSIGGAETGAGNALVGAYLERLGLPERAIFYATIAGPKEMLWLTPENAKKLGIDLQVLNENGTPAPPQVPTPLLPALPQPPDQSRLSPTHQRPGMTLEKAMKEMAVVVRGAWAQPSPDWDLLRRMYNERVLFHEKDMSADEVIASKRRFADKWPLRTYSIRQDDTLTASCLRPSNICDVRGIMDWRVRNPAQNKAESGVSTFEYKISWTGDYYVVLAETTKIISGDPLLGFFNYKAPGQQGSKPFNPFNDTKPGGIR